MEIWLIVSGVVLLICIILLAILLTPKKSVKKPSKPAKKAVSPAPPQVIKLPETQPKAKNIIEMEKKKRKRKEVQTWVADNPVIAARIVRKWLWEGKKRK